MIENHESNVVYLEAISSSLWNIANFKSRGLRPSLSNVGQERGNGSYELYQYCYRQNFFQTALDQSDSIKASRNKPSSNSFLKIASIRRHGQGEEGQNQNQSHHLKPMESQTALSREKIAKEDPRDHQDHSRDEKALTQA